MQASLPNLPAVSGRSKQLFDVWFLLQRRQNELQPNWGLLEKMINQNEVLEYTDIEKLIPHRAPFLLIDKLTNAVPGESATGIKAVSGGESYFAGHFPSNPVMPGVLIVEAMAQVAACVASLTLKDDQKDTLVFFATIDKTRFRKPVRPGDLLILDVQKTASKANLWKFSAKANVNSKIVAQAEFSAMIVEDDR